MTTVTVKGNGRASTTVEITPADANPNKAGHQVALAVGANMITIVHTAPDGETTGTYTVTVNRAATLPSATIAAGATVAEGADAVFTVTLDAPAPAPAPMTVAVDVTQTGAVLSEAPPASASFAAGESTETLAAATDDDLYEEADGTVTAALPDGTVLIGSRTFIVGLGSEIGCPGPSPPATAAPPSSATRSRSCLSVEESAALP